MLKRSSLLLIVIAILTLILLLSVYLMLAAQTFVWQLFVLSVGLIILIPFMIKEYRKYLHNEEVAAELQSLNREINMKQISHIETEQRLTEIKAKIKDYGIKPKWDGGE